jgi:hypothetical protein
MASLLLTLSRQTSVRIAEVAFLLILIAGVWMLAAEVLPQRFHKMRLIVAGSALAVSGILLIVATHWGQFG